MEGVCLLAGAGAGSVATQGWCPRRAGDLNGARAAHTAVVYGDGSHRGVLAFPSATAALAARRSSIPSYLGKEKFIIGAVRIAFTQHYAGSPFGKGWPTDGQRAAVTPKSILPWWLGPAEQSRALLCVL